MIPLLVMIFFMGLYPKPFIDKMDPAIKKLVAQVRVSTVNAQVIPVAGQECLPGTQQIPAGHPGEAVPPGHPGGEPSAVIQGAESTAPHAAPAVNPHEVK
jgi:NADH-quinone oxidoreductase subunit M